MFKKIAILLTLALVLAVGVFGVVKTTYAQEIEVEESPEVPVMIQENAMVEYQYAHQYGNMNGAADPILIQIRTQTQLRELQDGECDGECDCEGEQQQLRLNVNVNAGAGNQGQMRQQNLNHPNGTCDGTCVPLRQGGRGK